MGRPRDASVDTRVIEATLETISNVGLAGLSIDGVAAMAGVSKATIYRRWDSKDELVVDAIASLAQGVVFDLTGDVRADLIAVVTELRGYFCDTGAGEALPWLAGEVAGQTPLGSRYAAAVVIPKRALISDIISQAIRRGDLRSDLNVDTAVDMVIGPVIFRRLSGGFENTHASWAEDLADAILRGWAS